MKPIQVYYRTIAGRELNTELPNYRPEWFSYDKCWTNFRKTAIPEVCDITVVIDGEPTDVDKKRFEDSRIEWVDSKTLVTALLVDYEHNHTTYLDRNTQGDEIVKREEPPDKEKASGKLLYELIKKDNLSEGYDKKNMCEMIDVKKLNKSLITRIIKQNLLE